MGEEVYSILQISIARLCYISRASSSPFSRFLRQQYHLFRSPEAIPTMTGIRLFFQLFLYLFIHALFPEQVQAQPQNRTFSMVALNSASTAIAINNKIVVRASNANPSGIGIGFAGPVLLNVFIYNQKMYMGCSTSPTGVCIGYFQKNYGGLSRGWDFRFWTSEDFPNTDPIGSYAGRFGVRDVGGVNILFEGVDQSTGLNGSPNVQLCPYPGVTNSPYGVCIFLAPIKPWIN